MDYSNVAILSRAFTLRCISLILASCHSFISELLQWVEWLFCVSCSALYFRFLRGHCSCSSPAYKQKAVYFMQQSFATEAYARAENRKRTMLNKRGMQSPDCCCWYLHNASCMLNKLRSWDVKHSNEARRALFMRPTTFASATSLNSFN